MRYLFLFLFSFLCGGFALAQEYFRYDLLPELPANSDYFVQAGLAGPYTGIDQDALILAGGANFPDALPWEGGQKVYYDEIFVLTQNAAGESAWQLMAERLPEKAGYGGAVATSAGLFCFGGNTADRVLQKTWFIQYRADEDRVEITPGPDLPRPLTNFAFAKVNDDLYLAGGVEMPGGPATKTFWRIHLGGPDPAKAEWEELESWPGPARAFAVGAGQSNGVQNCFYLFSGRNVQPDQAVEILQDGYVYNPLLKTWEQIGTATTFPVMAGTAFPVGTSGIAFSSGADGQLMLRENELKKEVERWTGTADTMSLPRAERNLLAHLNDHPGFGKKLFLYNTVTDRMEIAGELPATGQVTTTAVPWGSSIIIPSGEIRPGVRTPRITRISIDKEAGQGLSTWDFLVVAVYLGVLGWMGFYFSKRQKNTDDYFKGGGRVPWWAAGLSIFGTALSAITFMAIPAKTFATDWSYFMLNMTIFLVAPLVILLFIPFYRRLNLTTAYEYLEQRFNLSVRLLGSASFILYQIGRMGVVLFLPSIALNVVTGIDIFLCIGVMGFISLIYTMMGGIEAVIWTDVVQVIVLLGGALLSLGLIISKVDGGFGGIVETGIQDHKFNLFDLDLSLRQPTFWVMLVGGMFANITTYGTDQTMVQRYLTTKSVKTANQSVWTNALLTIPATLIFFFLGTALYAFFQSFPAELNPTFANNDAIFPWYIVSQLPTGVSGLLIAGIFAAAMSSISSSMNSAATAYSTDFHFRFGWTAGIDRLRLARIATLIIGLSGTAFALIMATWDIQSLWDEFQKVLGLIIGGLGGVFLLGILSSRATGAGALVGISCSVIVQILVAYYQPVHLMLYSATGVLSCFICGWLASLILGDPSKVDLSLTYSGQKTLTDQEENTNN
ncbi:sodium:solute symporter family transporter [Flavilitoribacter nigricans]|uniref:Sodium:solute symporter n=1 Tax=Flavilitoribacter nigricans (strain ATCC 23147 / DSM 23189 / NBRC 102662 / NCIMB 1420 / SS-2) TaxID=1122177 RepID=A0A2D0NBR0_FLAN2|nr:sodium/solute symporter [Flavilitoribacter nigricans]PHN05925.1 hypothetical protein CRP01_13175 [Flavilitoribacter nigricans DSM 23189 = NBRC 102662]